MTAYRMKIKKFIKNQKATFKSVRDAQCNLQTTSEGNMAAYDIVLQTLCSLYQEVKASEPNLPLPPPVKPWRLECLVDVSIFEIVH